MRKNPRPKASACDQGRDYLFLAQSTAFRSPSRPGTKKPHSSAEQSRGNHELATALLKSRGVVGLEAMSQLSDFSFKKSNELPFRIELRIFTSFPEYTLVYERTTTASSIAGTKYTTSGVKSADAQGETLLNTRSHLVFRRNFITVDNAYLISLILTPVIVIDEVGRSPAPVSTFAILSTTSCPFTTCPKMEYRR